MKYRNILIAATLGFNLFSPQLQADVPTVAEYAYITDFNSGRVLLDKNAAQPMKPASMAKIMTTYLVFERIKEGSLSLDESFVVSEKAWKKGAHGCFWTPGRA